MKNKSQTLKQFILYLVVGGGATVVEWVLFYLINGRLGLHYAPATAIAFIISTFANWALGRLLLFKAKGSVLSELGSIYAAAVVGLLLNLAIMWVAVDLIGLPEQLSKMGATALVFFWNFAVRKFFIYKI